SLDAYSSLVGLKSSIIANYVSLINLGPLRLHFYESVVPALIQQQTTSWYEAKSLFQILAGSPYSTSVKLSSVSDAAFEYLSRQVRDNISVLETIEIITRSVDLSYNVFIPLSASFHSELEILRALNKVLEVEYEAQQGLTSPSLLSAFSRGSVSTE